MRDRLEPSAADMAAIEDEWPLIAAELYLVEAECRLARTPPDVVAERARRRAVHALLSALVQRSSHGPTRRLLLTHRQLADFSGNPATAPGTGPDAA